MNYELIAFLEFGIIVILVLYITFHFPSPRKIFTTTPPEKPRPPECKHRRSK